MPYMTDNPTQKVAQLVPGQAAYAFGTYNYDVAPSRMQILNVALSGSNVATLTVQVIEGPIPTVGSLISVTQTQTSGGIFNVNRATVTAVNISSGGNGTISYALTGSTIATTADAGTAIVDTPENADALVNGYSIPIALQAQPAQNQGGRFLSIWVSFPSLPTTCTVTLYGAMMNEKVAYVTTGVTAATVSGGAQSTAQLIQVAAGVWNYLCFVVTSVTGGTNPTLIAKILA